MVKFYTILIFSKDNRMYEFLKKMFKEFEFNFVNITEWENYKKFLSDHTPDLIVLTKETENFTEKKEFKKLRIREDKKIPVFILGKNVEEYEKMDFFKSEFIGNLKKVWQTGILPRKPSEFKVIKLGKEIREKRVHPRINIKIQVEVCYDYEKKNKGEGYLRNISAGGMSVNLLNDLGEQDKYWVRFSIKEGAHYFLRVEKLRVERKESHFHIAFRFIELAEKVKQEISEYVKELLFLKNTRLFDEFSEDELRYILKIGKKIEVPKGRIIFYEGMEGRELYIVMEGSIKIYKKKVIKEKESEVFLAGIHRGEFFGEMALLREMPRTATAEAIEDTILFKISKEYLEEILRDKKDMAIKMYRAFISGLVERLSRTNQELIDSPFTIPQEEVII